MEFLILNLRTKENRTYLSPKKFNFCRSDCCKCFVLDYRWLAGKPYNEVVDCVSTTYHGGFH